MRRNGSVRPKRVARRGRAGSTGRLGVVPSVLTRKGAHPMSILIVEDNTISLKTVEMMLQSNGLETLSAKSGVQALEWLESRTDIQLVLTDLMMPDLDGYQLLEAMGRNPSWKEIPAIAMTSLSDADTVRRVVGLGAKGYLVKPLREDALIPKIRQTMRDLPNGVENPLKAKFKVLEETGLDNARYESLFDEFQSQLLAAAALFEAGDPTGTDHPAVKAALSLREGASVLAAGSLPILLEGLRSRGTCDWPSLRAAFESTLAATKAVLEKRERLREKLARSEVSSVDA
jgi:CheY-like chemotaxis protein